MKGILRPILISSLLVVLIFIIFSNLEGQFQVMLTQLRERTNDYIFYSILILSSDIVLPVPSSIVMYLNGSVLGLYLGFLTSYVSVILTAFVGYLLGMFTSLGVRKSKESETQAFMKKYGYLAILVTRGIPILSESVCFVSGFKRYNFKLYLLLNLVGYIPICLIYAYFGNIGGNENQFLLSFFFSILLSLTLWVFGRKLFNEYSISKT